MFINKSDNETQLEAKLSLVLTGRFLLLLLL